MIDIKTQEEIGIMVEGGEILSDVLREVLKHTKAGVSGLELDQLAERLIVQKGGEPGFKKVRNYKHTLCVCVNDVVVHGIPTDYKFKEGDVITIDCGVYYKGFHTDMAETIEIENEKSIILGSIEEFLYAGKRALEEAIKQAKVGNRVGHISKTMQDIIESSGYSIVRSLVGHGVGRSLHEEPEVPGFLVGDILRTPVLKEGMTLAIEAIYNMGERDVAYANNDGWTIKTKDGSLSAVFEKTIVVARKGPVILTS